MANKYNNNYNCCYCYYNYHHKHNYNYNRRSPEGPKRISVLRSTMETDVINGKILHYMQSNNHDNNYKYHYNCYNHHYKHNYQDNNHKVK